MPRNKLNKLRYRTSGIKLGLALFCIASPQFAHVRSQQPASATQQQTPQPQQSAPSSAPPSTPSPKPKKVWTNDDLVALRSPADIYLIEKEQREAAEAAAAAKKPDPATESSKTGPTIQLPATAEETQEVIRTKEDHTRLLQERLEQLNSDLPNTEEAQKAGIQKQIDEVSHQIEELILQVKMLQKHLQDFPKAATPSESAPQNPQ